MTSQVEAVRTIVAPLTSRLLREVLLGFIWLGILGVTDTQWGKHASAAAVAGYVACVALIWLWASWRAWSEALRFDGRGVTVRNFWRTYRLSWPAVSQFADGYFHEHWEPGPRLPIWVLAIVMADGRGIAAMATRGDRSPASQRAMVEEIKEAAKLHAVRAQLSPGYFAGNLLYKHNSFRPSAPRQVAATHEHGLVEPD